MNTALMSVPDQPRHDPPSRPTPALAGGPAAPWLFTMAVLTLMGFACAAPWITAAAITTLSVESTTPIDWVPRSFGPRRAYDTFVQDFGSGDVVIASWPGCTIDAETVDPFITAATGPNQPDDAAGQPWFESVASAKAALERLTDPPLALDRQTAIQRLQGVLIGPDGRQSCLIIALTPAGLADRARSTAWIRDTLLRMTGVAPDDLHLAGPVIDNVAVDQASTESFNVYAAPAAVVILLLTWWSVRSVRYALAVFLLSLASVGLCFVSLQICGDRMNPVLIVMPLLVLTLGVSGGIHLVNYLVEASAAATGGEAARRAIALGFLPCALSAGTTALGLLSLLVSELEPIRVFGLHAAIGVLATLAVLFLVLPGLFSRWPIRRQAAARRTTPRVDSPAAAWMVNHSRSIIAVAALTMLAAAVGLTGIRTSVGIDTLFTTDSRVIRDYRWLEDNIGPLVPIEVVLRFAKDGDLRPADRLELVQDVGASLRDVPQVAGVVSADLFLPNLQTRRGPLAAAVQKSTLARKLEANLGRMADMRLVRDSDTEQLWRITARTSALAGLDYGVFLRQIRDRVDPIVAAAGGTARGVRADYTGVMPLINAIQNTLLWDLTASFLSACGVIAVVMMIVERGVLAGLVAMIPNVFPMLLLFGLLGWRRAALDIGSVMTASIALGMAVDGTFHFLTFFRRGLAGPAHPRGSAASRTAAVHEAYHHSAAPLAQSALVCGLGILAFAGSSFAPTRRFAWMLSLLVGLALVGDLVVLPALLTSRLGRWFRPRREPAD